MLGHRAYIDFSCLLCVTICCTNFLVKAKPSLTIRNNEHNPFDHYSSRNARINILLENFHFFHRPTTSAMDEKVDPKYIGKSNPMHQLYNWIKYNEANSGSYLVTGYRGAGKSSLVGKLMKDLQREENRYVMFPLPSI